MNEWFTVTQAADEIGIPAETVRRYMRQYGEFLQLKRGEKRSYLIHESSLDVIKKIRYLLEQGNQREQVEDVLKQTEAITVQTNDDQMDEYLMNLPQLQRETAKRMDNMARYMKEQSEQIQKQNELIEALSDKLDQQQEYIDQSIEKRDQQIIQTMNEIQEQKEAAASNAPEKKKGFFGRLFGKDD